MFPIVSYAIECRYLLEILIPILLDKYPQMGLLDYTVVLFFILCSLHTVFHGGWTNLQCIFLSSIYKGSLISTSLLKIISSLLDNSHLKRYEVISHCGFTISLEISDVKYLCIYCWSFGCPLWKNVCLVPLLIF